MGPTIQNITVIEKNSQQKDEHSKTLSEEPKPRQTAENETKYKEKPRHDRLKCKECSKRFEKRCYLKRHIQSAHNNDTKDVETETNVQKRRSLRQKAMNANKSKKLES